MNRDDPKKPRPKTHRPGRKVFDVVPPGKSPAAPNSRSVIVGHKPQVKDDQFVPGPSSDSSSDSGAASSRLAGVGMQAKLTTKSLASDPSEKRPLLDSHKKLELNPDVPGDSETISKGAATVEGAGKQRSASEERAESEGATTPPALPREAVDEGTKIEAPIPPAVQATSTQPQTERHADADMASEHLADLAVEQVVETETFKPPMAETTSRMPAGSIDRQDEPANPPGSLGTNQESTESAALTPPEEVASTTRPTPDDLLAETGAPDLAPQKAVVSTHHRRGGAGKLLLILLLIVVAAAIALDLLLDAGIIKTQTGIPHTDLIKG